MSAMIEIPESVDYPQPELFIDGEWLGVSGRRTHAVVNPATGRTLGELPLASAAATTAFFFEPTVLSAVPSGARIMNEEPFGPVALINPFKTFDDATEQANRLPYGLAAYAFTTSAKRAMLVGDALESGLVAINSAMVASADAPFGGVKESGHGAEDGPEGLEACLVTKVIHQA
jgi:acyl-CoA reductase-like NAD-dependent aldehyde dehydrogenase